MEAAFPTVAAIREALDPLTIAQLTALAETSGVPFTTLYKIKLGDTKNPGIETVRKFLPHLTALATAKA